MKFSLLLPVVSGLCVLLVSSCGPVHPGGLSDEEWNSLPPGKRAELTIQQEQADAARNANIERSLLRMQQQEEFNEMMELEAPQEPTVKLSQEDIDAINSMTSKKGTKKE